MKSTGPKSPAGKRRVAQNARQHVVPPEVERDIRAHGEDPRNYRRLCCDLAAIFPVEEPSDQAALDMMAHAWWEKRRRHCSHLRAGPPPCQDLDRIIEQALQFLVTNQRERHEHWRVRLAQAIGWPFGSPADVRRTIERRLQVYGPRRNRRPYPADIREAKNLVQFNQEFAEALALLVGKGPKESAPAAAREGKQSQTKPNSLIPTDTTTCGENGKNKANEAKSPVSSVLRRILGRFSA